ncbi:PQQ-dependent sugar dehydrogenase [Chloroflexota bacterium]
MSINTLLSRLIKISIVVGILISIRSMFDGVNAATNEVFWPEIEVVSYKSGFTSPVHIANAGDSSNRLFVVERGGKIQIIKGDVLLSTPFLDIQDRVQSTGGEEGLLSVAFPPNYASKGYFYVYYTNKNGDNQVSRFLSLMMWM